MFQKNTDYQQGCSCAVIEIHAVGGKLLIDSTFGPPPLQYPFKWGADCVFHSGIVIFIPSTT